MKLRVRIGRAIFKAMIVAGIVSALLFWKMRNTALFLVAVTCVALLFITFWLLLMCAKHGYESRLNQLRQNLLRMRTIGKRVGGDNSVDPIEEDEVDVLVPKQASSLRLVRDEAAGFTGTHPPYPERLAG